jgi:hypothetical protein
MYSNKDPTGGGPIFRAVSISIFLDQLCRGFFFFVIFDTIVRNMAWQASKSTLTSTWGKCGYVSVIQCFKYTPGSLHNVFATYLHMYVSTNIMNVLTVQIGNDAHDRSTVTVGDNYVDSTHCEHRPKFGGLFVPEGRSTCSCSPHTWPPSWKPFCGTLGVQFYLSLSLSPVGQRNSVEENSPTLIFFLLFPLARLSSLD